MINHTMECDKREKEKDGSEVEEDTESQNEGKAEERQRDKKKKEKRERAKERREKRRQDVSLLRTIPYSDHQRWWSADTIAVVTGANRGIGFEIAHQLAMHGLTVILTSRDAAVGKEAAKVLQEGGLNVLVHQLDIVDLSSVRVFTEWLRQHYGGADILVNNAGVNFNLGADNCLEFAEDVIRTNYFGTKNVIQAMIPLMRPSTSGARIVNVSSRLGRLNGRRNSCKWNCREVFLLGLLIDVIYQRDTDPNSISYMGKFVGSPVFSGLRKSCFVPVEEVPSYETR